MISPEKIPVSIIVTMRNSASTIIPCLEGLAAQAYPIAEIMVIDNVSTDNSVALVEEFAKQSPVPVRLIKQTVNPTIANSYNTGATLAMAPLLVLVHSDGAFPTTQEMEKLTQPVHDDPAGVAACPKILMPREVWERFPFWQKYMFSRVLDQEIHTMCGKFDCIRKEVFLKAGGYNVNRFTATCGYGGEDADAHQRITKLGSMAKSDARVIHLHDLSDNFGLRAVFITRKILARTYGKILQFRRFRPNFRNCLFFIRPLLAIIPVIPHLFWLGLALLLAFSLANSWRMYTSRSTLLNGRILMLPFVDAALVYYETFWFIEGLVTPPADARL